MMITIQSIAMMPINGLPLVVYGGISTFLLFLLTASIGIAQTKGIHFLSYQWHIRIAVLSLLFASVHALFAMSLFF